MEGSSSFDSSTVATLFAEKYYAQLSEDPKWLYRFYTSTGIMAHLGTPYANCKDESVVGTGNIEEKCNSIAKEYYGSKIDIKSVDSQFVTSSDITILTSGEIKFHNSTTVVPFIQSFYLEQNKNQSRSYSIRNSIFRTLSTSTPAPAPLLPLVVDTVVTKTPVVTDESITVPVVTTKVSHKNKHNDTNTSANTTTTAITTVKPIEEVINKVAEIDIKSSTKLNSPPSVEVTTESVAVLAQGQTVFSYADMVLADNQQPAPKEKVKNKSKPSSNTSSSTAAATTVAMAQSSASTTPVAMVEGAHIYNGKQKFSVYVHPVDGLTIDEVKTAFTRFGAVQHVSNFVIAKGTGGYAFVEFSCAEHMRAALDNKEPILIGEKIVKVEKKQIKDKSAQGKSDVTNDGSQEKGKVASEDNHDGTKTVGDANSVANGKSKQQKNKNQSETGVVKSPENITNGEKDQSNKGKGGASNANNKLAGGDKSKPNNDKQGDKKQVTTDGGVTKTNGKQAKTANNDNSKKA